MATLSIEVSKLTTGKLEHVALSRLRPSTTNPRKIFAETGLVELAQSIRERGILQPILVRALKIGSAYVEQGMGQVWYGCVVNLAGGGNKIQTFSARSADENASDAAAWVADYNTTTSPLEIVAGERRYRASKIAEMDAVPVIIAQLTDEEAMELQVIENLQREDVHPLEEAEGYRALKKAPAIIAQRVGKTLPYVLERLQLLKLEIVAKELFASGHIELTHAITLAKLTSHDQLRAIKNLMGWNHLPAKTDWLEAMRKAIKNHTGNYGRLVRDTPAMFDRWVRDHVFLVLKNAPWALSDAALLPEAGACTDCPKRTGASAALFASLTTAEDTCTDAKCYDAKRKAFIVQSANAAQEKGQKLVKLSNSESSQPRKATDKGPLKRGQWLRAKKGTCPDVVKGIFVDDPTRWQSTEKHHAGEMLLVCANQDCKTHPHRVSQPNAAPVTTAEREEQQRKAQAAVKGEYELRGMIFTAMLPQAKEEHGFLREVLYSAASSNAVLILTELGLYTEAPLPEDEDDEEAYDEEGYQKRRDLPLELLWKHLQSCTMDELHRIAFMVRAIHLMRFSEWEFERGDKRKLRAPLIELAARVGVDANAIVQRVETQRKQSAAAEKKAAAAAAKAAKKGGK